MDLKVKVTEPCFICDRDGNSIDVSKTQFENGERKAFTVPNTEFWVSRIVKGQLEQVVSRKVKETPPDEK